MDIPPKVLVTGGAGFIGSHVVEALLRAGAAVTIIDNLDSFYPVSYKLANLEEIAQVGKTAFYEIDVRDSQRLEPIFETERPECVVHLAALAGVRPSLLRAKMYQEVNVGGTLNLLDLSQRYQVKKFVFGSSSSVYGIAAAAPFSEEATGLRPVSPYAATKLAGELLCYTYSHLYALPMVCLRFFTVYGPRQRPDLAIRKFAELIEAGKPVPVYGDGNAGRDYTYIDDIVQGVLAAVAYQADFDIFNLGNSRPVKTLKLISLLETAVGKRAKLEFLPCQPGDVPLTWADIGKARSLLGYSPRVSLETGLGRFCAWRRTVPPQPAASLAARLPPEGHGSAWDMQREHGQSDTLIRAPGVSSRKNSVSG
jgi:UDP-glucuronate 4-epimerase